MNTDLQKIFLFFQIYTLIPAVPGYAEWRTTHILELSKMRGKVARMVLNKAGRIRWWMMRLRKWRMLVRCLSGFIALAVSGQLWLVLVKPIMFLDPADIAKQSVSKKGKTGEITKMWTWWNNLHQGNSNYSRMSRFHEMYWLLYESW